MTRGGGGVGREGGWLGQGGSGRKGGTGEKGGGWEEEKRGESEEGPEGGREEGGLRGLGREAQGPEPGRGRRAGWLARGRCERTALRQT